MRLLRVLTLLALSLVFSTSALAAAVTPQDGDFNFVEGEGRITVKNGKVTAFFSGVGYKCNRVPVKLENKAIAVKNGKFKYKGRVKTR